MPRSSIMHPSRAGPLSLAGDILGKSENWAEDPSPASGGPGGSCAVARTPRGTPKGPLPSPSLRKALSAKHSQPSPASASPPSPPPLIPAHSPPHPPESPPVQEAAGTLAHSSTSPATPQTKGRSTGPGTSLADSASPVLSASFPRSASSSSSASPSTSRWRSWHRRRSFASLGELSSSAEGSGANSAAKTGPGGAAGAGSAGPSTPGTKGRNAGQAQGSTYMTPKSPRFKLPLAMLSPKPRPFSAASEHRALGAAESSKLRVHDSPAPAPATPAQADAGAGRRQHPPPARKARSVSKKELESVRVEHAPEARGEARSGASSSLIDTPGVVPAGNGHASPAVADAARVASEVGAQDGAFSFPASLKGREGSMQLQQGSRGPVGAGKGGGGTASTSTSTSTSASSSASTVSSRSAGASSGSNIMSGGSSQSSKAKLTKANSANGRSSTASSRQGVEEVASKAKGTLHSETGGAAAEGSEKQLTTGPEGGSEGGEEEEEEEHKLVIESESEDEDVELGSKQGGVQSGESSLRNYYAQAVKASTQRIAGILGDSAVGGVPEVSAVQRKPALSLDTGGSSGSASSLSHVMEGAQAAEVAAPEEPMRRKATMRRGRGHMGSRSSRGNRGGTGEEDEMDPEKMGEMVTCWGGERKGALIGARSLLSPGPGAYTPSRASLARSPWRRGAQGQGSSKGEDWTPGARTPRHDPPTTPGGGTPSRLSTFFNRSKSLKPTAGSGTSNGDAPSYKSPMVGASGGSSTPGPEPARRSKTVPRQVGRSAGKDGDKGLMGEGLSDLKEVYDLGEKLGEGRCGVSVRRCVERSSGHAFACKSTPKSMLAEGRKVEALRTEVSIMQMLKGSPGIVQLHDVLEDQQDVHMVMELCQGGDLLTHINSCPHISEKQAATFCRLIASAVLQCHSAGVLHRDLKPENVLITARGAAAGVRVADFGISTMLTPGHLVTGYAGSPYYVAPEVLTGPYGFEADVWSLGVVLYVLLCQHLPFWDNSDAEIYQAILAGRYDTKSGAWLDISAHGIDLVRKMLCLDPRKRITLPQLLEHPWIVQNQLTEMSALVPAIPELPDMRLSRRRRAIARTEGAILGTLKLTFCMAAIQHSSSSESDDRGETFVLDGHESLENGCAD